MRWVALLGLCAAYLQGGIVKLTNSAAAEMNHLGLSPAMPFTSAVNAMELVASVAILTGYGRWLGALALVAFTIAATLMANRYRELGLLSTNIWDSTVVFFRFPGTTCAPDDYYEATPHLTFGY